jgi:malonyl CoA-acyl carrier protein transacylase
MHLIFDGDMTNPEIEFSGNVIELIDTGHRLVKFEEEMEILAQEAESKYYSENLKSVIFKISNQDFSNSLNLVSISIKNSSVVITGTKEAMNKLGKSILNIFNENSHSNEHFHLDCFEDNTQTASLIIVSRE